MLFKGQLSSFVLGSVSLKAGDSFIIGTEVMLTVVLAVPPNKA
jgi:hypothetical protein